MLGSAVARPPAVALLRACFSLPDPAPLAKCAGVTDLLAENEQHALSLARSCLSHLNSPAAFAPHLPVQLPPVPVSWCRPTPTSTLVDRQIAAAWPPACLPTLLPGLQG